MENEARKAKLVWMWSWNPHCALAAPHRHSTVAWAPFSPSQVLFSLSLRCFVPRVSSLQNNQNIYKVVKQAGSSQGVPGVLWEHKGGANPCSIPVCSAAAGAELTAAIPQNLQSERALLCVCVCRIFSASLPVQHSPGGAGSSTGAPQARVSPR